MGEKYHIPNDHDNLQKHAPWLAKIEKRNEFQVPAGYFDSLPSIIQERCIESSRTTISEKLERFKFYLYRLAIPVSFAAIIVFFGLNYLNPADVDNDLTAAEISIILEEDVNISIEETMLIEALMENESAQSAEFADEDEGLIDYLIDNDIDLSSIINEL